MCLLRSMRRFLCTTLWHAELSESVMFVIATAVKVRSGAPDSEELRLIRSHLNTISLETQLLTRNIEMNDVAAHELALHGADNWIRREATNIVDALRALDEKASLFRLYLNDVSGPQGSSHKHKLLFASQYLIESSIQLLRTIDKAVNEVVVQHAHRVAFLADKLFTSTFRVAPSTTTPPATAAVERVLILEKNYRIQSVSVRAQAGSSCDVAGIVRSVSRVALQCDLEALAAVARHGAATAARRHDKLGRRVRSCARRFVFDRWRWRWWQRQWPIAPSDAEAQRRFVGGGRRQQDAASRQDDNGFRSQPEQFVQTEQACRSSAVERNNSKLDDIIVTNATDNRSVTFR